MPGLVCLYTSIQGSFASIQGSFASTRGSFASIQGSFASIQGSFSSCQVNIFRVERPFANGHVHFRMGTCYANPLSPSSSSFLLFLLFLFPPSSAALLRRRILLLLANPLSPPSSLPSVPACELSPRPQSPLEQSPGRCCTRAPRATAIPPAVCSACMWVYVYMCVCARASARAHVVCMHM